MEQPTNSQYLAQPYYPSRQGTANNQPTQRPVATQGPYRGYPQQPQQFVQPPASNQAREPAGPIPNLGNTATHPLRSQESEATSFPSEDFKSTLWQQSIDKNITHGIAVLAQNLSVTITLTTTMYQEPSNVVFSPVNVAAALALVLVGSDGSTFNELSHVLGIAAGLNLRPEVRDLMYEVHQPRDDYKEFLKLSVIFLGGIPIGGISFMKPGPISKARWMNGAIYALKVRLFQDQLSLLPDKKKALDELCVFVVGAYIKAWFRSPSAAQAPNVDLEFLKIFKSQLNKGKWWQDVLNKILNHLRYLSSDLAPLALYDESVSVETRREMAAAIRVKAGQEDPPKRVQLTANTIDDNLNLNYFVNQNSSSFFNCLKLSDSFLSLDPDLWKSDESYQKGEIIVKNLRVVNDTAERSIKLATDFCSDLTREEKQRQICCLL